MLCLPHGSAGAAPPGTSANNLGLQELKGEPSRGELFDEMRKDDAQNDPTRSRDAQTFALTLHFRFPPDTLDDPATGKARSNSIFGMDISHYEATFPIEQLRQKRAMFLYIKASQGTAFVDGKFADYWARAGHLTGNSRIHRGAYHFLTAGPSEVDAAEWGRRQAATFLKVFKANNPASNPSRDTDMPPVMDLEWDRASKGAPDRWKNRTPDQILTMAKTFLSTVETALHRKPMIYTAQSWWHERVGQDARVDELDYPLWLADYSRDSRSPESPRLIHGKRWALWQFTEAAQMPLGYSGFFDADIFKGSESDFYKELGVKEF